MTNITVQNDFCHKTHANLANCNMFCNQNLPRKECSFSFALRIILQNFAQSKNPSMADLNRAFILLGGNIGDVSHTFDHARIAIDQLAGRVVRLSDKYVVSRGAWTLFPLFWTRHLSLKRQIVQISYWKYCWILKPILAEQDLQEFANPAPWI